MGHGALRGAAVPLRRRRLPDAARRWSPRAAVIVQRGPSSSRTRGTASSACDAAAVCADARLRGRHARPRSAAANGTASSSTRTVHGPRRPRGRGALLGDLVALLARRRPSRVLRVRVRRRPAADHRRLRRRAWLPRCGARPAECAARTRERGACAIDSRRARARAATTPSGTPTTTSPRASPRCALCHEQDATRGRARRRSRPRTTRSRPRSRTPGARRARESAEARRGDKTRPADDEDEPTELELTPMGNRRSAVTESEELDYRLPDPSLLRRSTAARARRLEPGAGRQAAGRDARPLRHRGADRRAASPARA